jgi:hypothetical protein
MSEKRTSLDREEAEPRGGAAAAAAAFKAASVPVNQGPPQRDKGDNQEWSPTKDGEDPSEEFQEKIKVCGEN